jgi:hypothetical protein
MQAFLSDPAGLALKGMVVAAFVDFAFGVFAALKDGSFSFDAVAAFVRKHLLGRVGPIGILLALGYFNHDAVMSAAGVAAGTAYVLETMGSIYGSIKPPAESAAKVDDAEKIGNPIPQD